MPEQQTPVHSRGAHWVVRRALKEVGMKSPDRIARHILNVMYDEGFHILHISEIDYYDTSNNGT